MRMRGVEFTKYAFHLSGCSADQIDQGLVLSWDLSPVKDRYEL